MRRLLIIFLSISLIFTLLPATVLAAPDWPSETGIEAEAGILIDAESGAVLFGQNIHLPYYPASITKILTALIVIENCSMDEIVTFSKNAVYNVESGSSNAGFDTGDTMSVKDCLYAMLLKSANEAANALAEHVAGSIDNFADMMNEKAASLGCTESHFSNPSGLNDEAHYTTAYDYALIVKAAFSNPTFIDIDSTTYYDLPPNSKYPEGQTIYCGHKMLKKNSSEYYPGIIGGKTGYTMLAGNTLVTCAERDGMKLITVILKSTQTHYSDTRTLLDFGFSNFSSLRIGDFDSEYTKALEDLSFAGLPATNISVLSIDKNRKISIPKNASYTDTQTELTYDLTVSDPADAVAKILYSYNGRAVGTTYLVRSNVSGLKDDSLTAVPAPPPQEEPFAETPLSDTSNTPEDKADVPTKDYTPLYYAIAAILGTTLLLLVIVFIVLHFRKKRQRENEARIARQERRIQRLAQTGLSDETFQNLMRERKALKEINKVSLKDRIFKRRHKF